MRIALLFSTLATGYGSRRHVRDTEASEVKRAQKKLHAVKRRLASSQPDRHQRLTGRGKLSRASGAERILGEQIVFFPVRTMCADLH